MISQDAGFKYLLGRYPDEALALFCPEALAERGAPAQAILVATEIPPLTSDGSHRVMDLAVRFSWKDHPPLIITLLEHWSDRHRIDLPRVLRYTAELGLRHRDAAILPIILLTDDWPADRPHPMLTHGIGAWQPIRLKPRLVPLRRPDAIPPGHIANHVAILLAALVPVDPAQRPDLIADIVARYQVLSHAVEDLRVLLPWLMKLANITTNTEVTATYQRLYEDHRMLNIIDMIEAKGEAKGEARGEAKGEAKGLVRALLDLVADGDLAADRARTRLRHLADQQQITAAQLAEALAALDRPRG